MRVSLTVSISGFPFADAAPLPYHALQVCLLTELESKDLPQTNDNVGAYLPKRTNRPVTDGVLAQPFRCQDGEGG